MVLTFFVCLEQADLRACSVSRAEVRAVLLKLQLQVAEPAMCKQGQNEQSEQDIDTAGSCGNVLSSAQLEEQHPNYVARETALTRTHVSARNTCEYRAQ